MKKTFLPFLGITLLLLVGAGCKKATPDPAAIEAARVTREQRAYVYCSSKNYTPQIRFDSEVNRNRLLCIFEPGKECDALAFMDGTCDPKKVAVETSINESLTPPGARFNCSAIAKAVCTTENTTYTNRCIAEAQGKQVKHEGVCTENEEPFELKDLKGVDKTVIKPPVETNPRTSISRTPSWPVRDKVPPSVSSHQQVSPQVSTAPSTPSSEISSAEWIGNLTSVLQSSASPYRITLSECKEGGKTYYYQKEDCSNCFKILYNTAGESQCYPGLNDEACPVWHEKNCKVIWTK